MTDLKVDVTNLKKNYGSNQVLKGIDFKVANNEVVVLIGPSGSGKSTLLRCLNKLEEPTSGSIVIDGHDISDPKTNIDKARENIGMVFQHFNLFNNLSVGENIMLAPVELGKANKDEAMTTAKKLLETVSLAKPISWVTTTIVIPSLARSFITSKTSPTISGSSAEVGSSNNMISGFIAKARAIATRCFCPPEIMADGYVVEEGRPEAIFEDPQNERTKAFLEKVINI